jgi:hypothetical protein
LNGSRRSGRERARDVLLELARSRRRRSAERAASIVRAEVAVPGFCGQPREWLALHADQRGVIAAFQVSPPSR